MANAVDLHGVAFKHGSATLLARVVGADATAIIPLDIASAKYTAYLLDPRDPDAATPIDGHVDVAVDVATLLYDTLQKDDLWSVDAVGYNFKHVLDVSANHALVVAGRDHRIVFELMPNDGQIILVRFALRVI